MDILINLLTEAQIDPRRALVAALLLLLLPTLYFFMARARAMLNAGKPVRLRPIQAFESLNRAMGRAAETGRPVHISLGTGGVGDATTAESLAALTLLDQVAQKAVSYHAQPIVTTADPTLLVAAQQRIQYAYTRRGFPKGYDSSKVRLIAPDRTAYAAGIIDLLENEPLSGNVMLGAFGDEYLLMGEVGAARTPDQVAGAADPAVLPFVYATAEQPLLGEEIFAAGAYMGRLASHIGSLFAQDWVRVLLVLIILGGVLVASLS